MGEKAAETVEGVEILGNGFYFLYKTSRQQEKGECVPGRDCVKALKQPL